MVQGSKITFSPQFCVFVALTLFLIPLPWLLGWLAAAFVHELFHCFALILCSKRIEHVDININGAQIQTENLTDGQTVFCSLAGPIGGLLLLTAANVLPRLALCALLQSVYNLLPIYPLDGGRALLGLTNLLFTECTARNMFLVIEASVMIGVLLLCCVVTFVWKLGIIPLVFGILFTLRMKKIKIPCKYMLNRVQ